MLTRWEKFWGSLPVLIAVLLTLLWVVTSFGGGGRAPKPAEPIPAPSGVITPTGVWFRCATCSAAEAEKMKRIEVKAHETVASQCFEDFMLKWGLIQTEGRTPAEVVSHLRTAELTVPVHYYYSRTSTVGYRVPPRPDIYLNRRFHMGYDDCDGASNATHERAHGLGYGHPSRRTATRGRTVNYAINRAYDVCCK